jgi:hypothetical protein
MPPSVSTSDFLRAFWNCGLDNLYGEVHLLRPRPGAKDESQPWFNKLPEGFDAAVAKIAAATGAWNVYFGVGLRSKMRGKDEDVACLPAVWTDIDFKVTPEETAREKLRGFPLKPSIVVRTGGGVHAYWLLREAAVGTELTKVRPILKAIARAVGGDTAVCTLKQIMRVPGSVNIKYSPHRPVTITFWNPDLRYSLSDFDLLHIEEEPVPLPASGAAPAEPGRELPQELKTKLATLMAEIWLEGYRHRLALYVGGLMAHAGYSQASAVHLVKSISILANDTEEGGRIRDVEDTYARFRTAGTVAGLPAAERLIDSSFPPLIQARAKKVLELIKKAFPKPLGRPQNQTMPDFDVTELVKFNSRPARYVAKLTLKDGNRLIEVTCETEALFKYHMFKIVCYEQADVVLAATTQARWEEAISKARLETRDAPKEAHAGGAIESALEEFLRHKRADVEAGDLKAHPGFDEATTFFRLPTFKGFMKDMGLKVPDQVIFNQLKDMGWEPTSKRLGSDVVRIWERAEPLNGNGTHVKPTPADLFGQVEGIGEV